MFRRARFSSLFYFFVVNLMLKILIKGTKEVPTRSPYYVKYAKEGTKDDALADFISLKLDGIRRSKTNSQVKLFFFKFII